MKLLTTVLSGSVLAASLGLMTAAPSAMLTQDRPSTPQANPDETKLIEGRVVCLYSYLGADEEDRERERSRDRERDGDREGERDRQWDQYRSSGDHQGPLGLVVERDRIIGSTTTVHVILLDPNSDSSKENYKKAREHMGKPVAVTAHQFERDGVSGVALIEINERTREGREGREDREDRRDTPRRR